VRALVLGLLALGFLYVWDGSRQPVSGDGWRLLIAQRGLGKLNSVTLIRDQSALDGAWEALRVRAAPPRVDFGRAVVVWFVDTGTFGCRSRLDGLVVDPGRRLVAGAFGRGLVSGCDDAEVPDSFLVVVDRRVVPAAPWTLQLSEPLPPDSPAARLEVID
jgi:hypothetical protein